MGKQALLMFKSCKILFKRNQLNSIRMTSKIEKEFTSFSCVKYGDLCNFRAKIYFETINKQNSVNTFFYFLRFHFFIINVKP